MKYLKAIVIVMLISCVVWVILYALPKIEKAHLEKEKLQRTEAQIRHDDNHLLIRRYGEASAYKQDQILELLLNMPGAELEIGKEEVEHKEK